MLVKKWEGKALGPRGEVGQTKYTEKLAKCHYRQWIHDNRHEYRDVFGDDLVYYDKVDVCCSWCS